MEAVDGWRIRTVRISAVLLGVIGVASIALLVKSVIVGDNEPVALLGIPALGALVAVPSWPVRDRARFSDRTAIVGWLLLLVGALLLIAYVGVILILFAIPYLAAAYIPRRPAR